MLEIFKNIKSNKYIFKRLTPKRALNYVLYFISKKLNTKICYHYPTKLDIVPTKACNLDCIFCIKYSTDGSKRLSLENFKIMASKLFPYSLMVSFCSGGEPFLNKDMIEILKITSNYNISTTITTNGTYLTDEISEFIVKKSSIDFIHISIDGAYKNTVERIRKNLDFELITKNVKRLAEIKKKNGGNGPRIIARYAVMRRNVSELPAFMEYCKNTGIEEVHVSYLFVSNDINPDASLYFHPELIEKYFPMAEEYSKVYGIKLLLPPKITKNKLENNPCYQPRNFMMTDTDGSVRFCYRAWEQPVGNILKDEFFHIWNNDTYRKLREKTNTDKPYFRFCRICSAKIGMSIPSSHILAEQNEENFGFDE